MAPRLKESYKNQVIPELMKRLGVGNRYAVPKLRHVVINVGVSEAKENIKALDVASEELAAIAGQKPQVRRAKVSISNFKLRQGMPIGVRVTLRGDRMYEFVDRFINTAVPRIRDFRGFNPGGFDGTGNYNLGLTEQHIFQEINLEKSEKVRGMNISFVTTAKTDEHGRELLGLLGFPFRKTAEKKEKNPPKEAAG